MKVLVGGASGLIGKALKKLLESNGHIVSRLIRGPRTSTNKLKWDPNSNELDPKCLDEFDVVVCLSGAGIAEARWSRSKKQQILKSRVDSVHCVVDGILNCTTPPKLLVCASAIGVYGADRGDEAIGETSSLGNDFLADVCYQWEEAASSLSHTDIRVVHLRLGVVLSSQGGALRKMLFPFRAGLGGRIGTGQQWMSWISIVDAIRTIEFVIAQENLSGPVNVVAPAPVRNIEFTQALATRYNRIPLFPIPALAIRLILGEMGETLLLNGPCVYPNKLLESGFKFEHETIEVALRKLL